MPVRIAVIAEAEPDRRQICEMVDRKVMDHAPDWWGREQLEEEREYCGLIPETLFTRWTELRSLPSPEGALRRGGFIGFPKGKQRHYDYPLARKALNGCVLASPRIDAAILVRDMDQQPNERAESLEQACNEISPNALSVVLALPTAKREAWVLNGFDPRDRNEEKVLAVVRRELGYDPRMSPERLDAMKHGAKHDAKRVLGILLGEDRDHDRELQCWQETPWTVLRERGKGSRLTDFLTDVKDRLVPRIIGA